MGFKSRKELDAQVKIWALLPEETRRAITALRKRKGSNQQKARQELMEYGFLLDLTIPRWPSYEVAKEIVRDLKIRSSYKYPSLRPAGLPGHPTKVYCNKGWTSWEDFLGRKFLPFKEARTIVHSFGLQNTEEWRAWCNSGNRPIDIPTKPSRVYRKEGWVSLGDFLGNSNVSPQHRKFRSFEEACVFARGLELKNPQEWRKWSRSGNRPIDIPSAPDKTYKSEGWKNWGNFLRARNGVANSKGMRT